MTNPTDLQYRLYVTQLDDVLDNLATNPTIRNGVFANVAWQVMMQTPRTQMAELRAVMAQAANLGMNVTPGFRCMEIKPPLGWMDVAHWQRNADYLYLLICEFPSLIGSAIAFDLESYVADTPRPPDVAAQTIAMAPFLKAIRDTRITPIIYPARPDHIPTLAIGDAVGGNLEVWTEAEYDFSEQLRADPKRATATTVLFSRIHTQFKQRWSNVVVRHGANDHLLRDWGFAGRASMIDYGLWAPFLFDKVRFDNAKIGTPEWCSGATMSTTNDLKHVWYPSGAPPQAGRAMAKTRVLPAIPGARTDLSSTLGTLCTDGMALCAFDVIPRPANGSSDITVQHEFLLPPTGGGPIFGACQMNHGSWQVVYDATLNQIVLELRQSSTSKVTSVIVDNPPKMVPIRVIVSAPKAGTQWQHSAIVKVAGAWGLVKTGSLPSPIAVNAGAGSLWVGAGVVLPSGGAAKQSFFEGLISTRTELHHRRMDATEMALALSRPYPRSS